MSSSVQEGMMTVDKGESQGLVLSSGGRGDCGQRRVTRSLLCSGGHGDS